MSNEYNKRLSFIKTAITLTLMLFISGCPGTKNQVKVIFPGQQKAECLFTSQGFHSGVLELTFNCPAGIFTFELNNPEFRELIINLPRFRNLEHCGIMYEKREILRYNKGAESPEGINVTGSEKKYIIRLSGEIFKAYSGPFKIKVVNEWR